MTAALPRQGEQGPDLRAVDRAALESLEAMGGLGSVTAWRSSARRIAAETST